VLGPSKQVSGQATPIYTYMEEGEKHKDYERFYFAAVQTGKQHYSQLFKPKN